jgi:tetraacyldisaccharide 4'-kinase
MSFPSFVRWLLWPFSFLYGLILRLRALCYRVRILKARRLAQPVISVGNLTVGGTGKTPLVLWLAQRLQTDGKRVGILSRGYRGRTRRGSGDAHGSPQPSSDEVRMLAARSHAVLGVGANRYRTALSLERERIELFLLDDGFQHLRLARDLDVVLVDATNPFGGGWMLPAGPLRESLSALSRAGAIVITRSERAPAVETLVRRHTNAPIFYAQTSLAAVLERGQPSPGTREVDPKQHRYLLFCGIGNPQAFRDDAGRWGIKVLGSTFFRDHHRYTQPEASQLERLAAAMGATALLCTEKDIFNLESVRLDSLPVHFCRIDMRLNDEEHFLSIVRGAVDRRTGTARK